MSQMNTNDLRKAKRWLYKKRKNWFGINAKSICEECVEKQIPEIVKVQEMSSDIIKSGYCPSCGRVVFYGLTDHYCPQCGQALDWGDPAEYIERAISQLQNLKNDKEQFIVNNVSAEDAYEIDIKALEIAIDVLTKRKDKYHV